MPRLLPRLLQNLKNAPGRPLPPLPPPGPRRRNLQANQPPPDLPSLFPQGRTQSIVVDSLEPLIKNNHYRRHKSWLPRLRVVRRRRSQDVSHPQPEHRKMSAEERAFWSDPYLRMIASPMRLCKLTDRYLPQDFMIRMSATRLPGLRFGKIATTVLPDGLEHPRFAKRLSGTGQYFVCWKEACGLVIERTVFKQLSPNSVIHSRIIDHVATLLRARVLQELHLLAEHLQRHKSGALDAPLLRRLTRAEWKDFKASGVLPYANAVAVIVAPPLNRDPQTKIRPEPSSSPLPIEEEPKGVRPPPPPSVLYPTGEDLVHSELPTILTEPKVPLYNSVTIFSSRPHRAALHTGLTHLLKIERRARLAEQNQLNNAAMPPEAVTKPESGVKSASTPVRTYGDNKSSHAFVLFSDADTILRADTVPLAIALWRLRMWEGDGFGNSEEIAGAWTIDNKHSTQL